MSDDLKTKKELMSRINADLFQNYDNEYEVYQYSRPIYTDKKTGQLLLAETLSQLNDYIKENNCLTAVCNYLSHNNNKPGTYAVHITGLKPKGQRQEIDDLSDFFLGVQNANKGNTIKMTDGNNKNA